MLLALGACVHNPKVEVPSYLDEHKTDYQVDIPAKLFQDHAAVLDQAGSMQQQVGFAALAPCSLPTANPLLDGAFHLSSYDTAGVDALAVDIATAHQKALAGLGDWGEDAVMREAVKTFTLAHVVGRWPAVRSQIMTAAVPNGKLAVLAPKPLGAADFRAFLDRITGAVPPKDNTVTENAVSAKATATAEETFPGQLLLSRGTVRVASDSYSFAEVLLRYSRAYYEGKFVDRFGKMHDKPDLKEGIKDAAVAGYVTVVLEAAADYVLRTPIVASKDFPGAGVADPKEITYYPAGTNAMPSALLMVDVASKPPRHLVRAMQVTSKDNGCGITQAESRAIAWASTYASDRLVAWAGALLEGLASVHVGFIIAGNFAVGSNDTVMVAAKAFLEVVARRGSEHLLMTVLNKMPTPYLDQVFDALPVPAKS
ncbi:hypothetical protein D3093_33915 (plasmid) [Azospirillum argentinense]|uniref:Uncharacterized protein n=1 Tax=Azospirillum argentinense TaxID=2970906 RepID=A0A4D8PTW5_9PROT|nr:hypothetical protein [Azospirillum argentinense]QCO00238.1 hypothetical protein D3093_33915 [Azospirillum argentinense]